MKKSLLLFVPVVLLAAGAFWYWSGENPAGLPPLPPAPRPGPPPTRTLTDPAVIFKRAFWREPGAGDRVLQAERNEWSDAEGLTRWEWFLQVEPSPELVKYLREENAFGLRPVPAPVLPEGSPAWFSFDPATVSVMSSPRGKMQLVFDQAGNRLFASDSGGGFQRGAAAPARPDPDTSSAAPPPAGRLPATPPPLPKP